MLLPPPSAPPAVRQLFALESKLQPLALDPAPLIETHVTAWYLANRAQVRARRRSSALGLHVPALILLQRAQRVALRALDSLEPALITQVKRPDTLTIAGLIAFKL
jgi:hypothetical protein